MVMLMVCTLPGVEIKDQTLVGLQYTNDANPEVLSFLASEILQPSF